MQGNKKNIRKILYRTITYFMGLHDVCTMLHLGGWGWGQAIWELHSESLSTIWQEQTIVMVEDRFHTSTRKALSMMNLESCSSVLLVK